MNAPMTTGSEITLPPTSRYLGARITITRTGGLTATGRLIAVTEEGIELQLDDGAVTVAPYATTTSARIAEPKTAAAPTGEAVVCELAECEQFREWLSGEKAEADKRARQAEAERDAVRAELATVLNNYAGLQGEAITLEGERDEARIEAGQIRAELAEERARHGELVAEMQRARQTADEARAEQVRLAGQVRVLSGLLRRGNPKVFCSKHPDHAEPGCEVCRDAEIFRTAVEGTEDDRG